MALFNEILAARYNNGLRRLLGMKGDAPAPQLSGDIVADITLESDRPEWLYLRGERHCSGYLTKAGQAAVPTVHRFVNPTGSGILTVVEQVTSFIGTATNIVIRIHNTLTILDSVINGMVRDSRYRLTTSMGACLLSARAAAVTAADGNDIHNETAPVGTNVKYTQPIMLAPGSAIDIYTADVNITNTVSVDWRERALESGES